MATDKEARFIVGFITGLILGLCGIFYDTYQFWVILFWCYYSGEVVTRLSKKE